MQTQVNTFPQVIPSLPSPSPGDWLKQHLVGLFPRYFVFYIFIIHISFKISNGIPLGRWFSNFFVSGPLCTLKIEDPKEFLIKRVIPVI